MSERSVIRFGGKLRNGTVGGIRGDEGHRGGGESVALELSAIDIPKVVVGRVHEVIRPIGKRDTRYSDWSFIECHMIGAVMKRDHCGVVTVPGSECRVNGLGRATPPPWLRN